MTILHLPSWFPNKKNEVSGIFTLKHIQAFSQIPGTRHFVLNWHDTRYATPKKPFVFFSAFLDSLKRSKQSKKENIDFIVFDLFQSTEFLFGKNHNRLVRRAVNESVKLVKKESINLLHAHVSYPAGFIAMKVAARTGIPYIISEHMGPFPFEEYKSSQTWLDDHIIQPIRKSKMIIAVSNTQKKQIQALTNVDPIVIPNIVDENEFKFSNGTSNQSFTFLVVAQLDKNKGIDILLEAMARLLKSRKDFAVKICGAGSILNDLKSMADEMGISEYVQWSGNLPRNEVVASIQQCNCLISCSRFESFGVTLVEALACGKPVIATRSGGPEDIVNAENGLLIEKENPAALADSMLFMIDHAKNYSPEKIRAGYEQRYSTKIIAQRYYEEVYSKIS